MGKKLKRTLPDLTGIKPRKRLKNNCQINIMFGESTWEALSTIPYGKRSAFIRQAIEEKIVHNPQYIKSPKIRGGKSTVIKVPSVLLMALQGIPPRDRSMFVRQAVSELLAKESGRCPESCNYP